MLDYKNGRYDIASFHLSVEKPGKALLARVRKMTHAKTDTPAYTLGCQHGFMIPTGIPKNTQNLADSLRTDLTFINRQRPSKSSVLLNNNATLGKT